MTQERAGAGVDQAQFDEAAHSVGETLQTGEDGTLEPSPSFLAGAVEPWLALHFLCVCVCVRTLKRNVPRMSVCAVSMPYGSAYLVLSRFGKPSRLKPGKQSMAMVDSIKAPPAGILTTWTRRLTGSGPHTLPV